jgi:hypothetical protein
MAMSENQEPPAPQSGPATPNESEIADTITTKRGMPAWSERIAQTALYRISQPVVRAAQPSVTRVRCPSDDFPLGLAQIAAPPDDTRDQDRGVRLGISRMVQNNSRPPYDGPLSAVLMLAWAAVAVAMLLAASWR